MFLKFLKVAALVGRFRWPGS